MDKCRPTEIQTRFVNAAFNAIDLPATNQQTEQTLLADLFIAKSMAATADKKKKTVTEHFKKVFGDKLSTIGDHDNLLSVAPFVLSAKVTSPRETFDKDVFIKAVADKFDLSLSDLLAIAATATKKSAAPISFDVIIASESQF